MTTSRDSLRIPTLSNNFHNTCSGPLTSEEDSIAGSGKHLQDGQFTKKARLNETDRGDSKPVERTLNSSDPIQSEFADYILQCKSVFKCRLCPRIVCLNEDTVKAHLNSKVIIISASLHAWSCQFS